MSVINEIVFENRTVHSHTAPDSGLVLYFVDGIPFIRTGAGVTPGQIIAKLPYAQFASGGQVLPTDTDLDFVEVVNTVSGLSFDAETTHAFTLPVGVWEIKFFVEIDNTGGDNNAGTYRKITLTVGGEIYNYDIRSPLGTAQNLSFNVIVANTESKSAMITFTHDATTLVEAVETPAELDVGDICYISFIKVA